MEFIRTLCRVISQPASDLKLLGGHGFPLPAFLATISITFSERSIVKDLPELVGSLLKDLRGRIRKTRTKEPQRVLSAMRKGPSGQGQGDGGHPDGREGFGGSGRGRGGSSQRGGSGESKFGDAKPHEGLTLGVSHSLSRWMGESLGKPFLPGSEEIRESSGIASGPGLAGAQTRSFTLTPLLGLAVLFSSSSSFPTTSLREGRCGRGRRVTDTASSSG